MGSNLYSILNRSCSNLKSNRGFSETLFENAFTTSRSLYIRSFSKISLFSNVNSIESPRMSTIPELEKWVKNGKEVRVGDLKRIVHHLRKRGRYTQALEVSDWMGKKGDCTFSPGDHAVQLDLIGKVRGLEFAETYFNNLSGQDKTEKTYGALLNCYTRERLTDKAVSLMQKMKDMGLGSAPINYNDLMSLYTNIGEYEKIPGLLAEMKENGISPNNSSYRFCLDSYGVRSDIDGMEKVLEEMENQSDITIDWSTYALVANSYIKAGLTDKATDMLKKAEKKLDKKDGPGYNHLISLYASLGNKAKIMRLWWRLKNAFKRHINTDYITLLSSLVKLGELEEAEKWFKEWESSDNSYDFRVPNVLLVEYTQKGMVEKAEAMLEELAKKGKSPVSNNWGIVAAGYANKNEMKAAVDCMKRALLVHVGDKGWKPKPKFISRVLCWLGDEGEIEEVEAFVESLKTVIPMNLDMYHALIKVSIRGGKEVDGLLKNMKADKIDEDKETKKILSERQVKAV